MGIGVYNANGKMVATLLSEVVSDIGIYTLEWKSATGVLDGCIVLMPCGVYQQSKPISPG